jgi:VanZ family protein
MLERPRESEALSWLAVALWSGLVFATVPLARWIEAFVVSHFGRDLFLAGVLAAVVAAGAAAAAALRRARSLATVRGLWLGGVVAAYAAASVALRANAEEAVHFVEYGVLGVLAFRALGHRLHDASIYVAAALVGGMVGLVDEAIQWLVPRRVWDLRDLALNLGGASGVQLALAFGLRPDWVEPRFRAAGVRRLCGIAALAVALLGLSLLNTPARIAWLGANLPGLGFLLRSGDVMLEYGHLHEEPGVGRFRSRFTLSELAALDAARAAEAGAALARSDDADYEAFLTRHSPVTDPFLHEARVHLFRRDRYLETGDLHAREGDADWARRDWTVAYREDRILARHFGLTLAASGRALPPDVAQRLAEEQIARHDYESPVGRGLVTRVAERDVVLALSAGFAALGAAAGVSGRRAEGPAAGRVRG